MKKSLFTRFATAVTVVSLAVVAMTSCGVKSAVIDGTVTGLEDGGKVWLLDNEQNPLDSTVVAGGKFRFDVAEAYPDFNVLMFEGMRSVIPFFIEPGAISVTVNFDAGQADASITGTSSNNAKKAIEDSLNTDLQTNTYAIMSRLSLLYAEGMQDTPEYDSLLNAIYRIEDEQERYRRNAVLENPKTVFAAWYAHRRAHILTTPEMVDSVLNVIDGAPANAFTDRLRERRKILDGTATGRPAPDFTQNMADGTPFTLSSLRGKPVLIDFWASWCGPCRAENPNVVRIYDRFKDFGFEIVGVSLDGDREAWLNGIEQDGLPWIHVSDLKGWGNAVARQYAVGSIPHTVLVDADGVIIAKNLRGNALESKIAEVLGVTE